MKAVYAGSFDPITNGHLWIIERAAAMFPSLTVAIGINPDKRSTFTLDQRLDMIRRTTTRFPNVTITHFVNQFLVHYAQSIEADFIIRGIRNEADYTFERTMRHINADIDPQITTIFLSPPRDVAEVSSSLVRGLVGPAGWEDIVKKYVPEEVFRAIKENHETRPH